MSDINDDLLNYDDDDLLLSDDESSTAKLTQNDEALLLDDDDDLLTFPEQPASSSQTSDSQRFDDTDTDATNADEPSASSSAGDAKDAAKPSLCAREAVSTSTPLGDRPTAGSPETKRPRSNTAIGHSRHTNATTVNPDDDEAPRLRSTSFKRGTTTAKAPADSHNGAQRLRIEASEFVPVAQSPPDAQSIVSTSSDCVDLRHEDTDELASQCTLPELDADGQLRTPTSQPDRPTVADSDDAPSSQTTDRTGGTATDADTSSAHLADLETDDGSDADDGHSERYNPKHRVERERDEPLPAASQPHPYGRSSRGGRGAAYASRVHQANGRYAPPNENYAYGQQRSATGSSLLMNPHIGGPPLLPFGPGQQMLSPPPSQQPQPQMARAGFRPMFNGGAHHHGPPGQPPPPAMVPPHMQHLRPFHPHHGPPHLHHQPHPHLLQHHAPMGFAPPFNGAMRPPPQQPPAMFAPHMQPHPQHRAPLHGQPPHLMGAYMQPRMPFAGPPPNGGLMPTPGNAPMLGPAGTTGAPASAGGPAIAMPRKVLINPNFKGGVQAATNQLMLDTMKNPAQYSMSMATGAGPASGGGPATTARRDDELLRQQEAFINQNRMQIEKRRYERSPERDRSYSPRRSDRGDRRHSRDRDNGGAPSAAGRKTSGGARAGQRHADNGRGRRAGSREHPAQSSGVPAKRRKSTSIERDHRNAGPAAASKAAKEALPAPPEDAETRAYRLEIEKQKLQREKILKDKELRRRRAAEVLKTANAGETPSQPAAQPPAAAALRLKKPPTEGIVVGRSNTIPTAKAFADSKPRGAAGAPNAATAVVKPVVKPSATVMPSKLADRQKAQPPQAQHHIVFDAKFGDERLLVDATSSATAGGLQTARFSNRRVMLKPSSQPGGNSAASARTDTSAVGAGSSVAGSPATARPKGIFDRLDRKVINVSDAAKRKIQRIVVQNTD